MAEARNWREAPQRFRFEAEKCTGCGKVHFPKRLVCNKCGEKSFEAYTLPNEGELVTYTVIHVPPTPFSDEAPYAMGIVELTDGTRLTAQIADCNLDTIKVGMKVKSEFRKIQCYGEAGIIAYGYKFVAL